MKNLLEKKLGHLKVKLASKSPRIQELLGNIITHFEIVNNEIDEVYPKFLNTNEVAMYLSRLKAEVFLKRAAKNELYITADTLVIFNNMILGKPKSKINAFNMLKKLSGNTHEVFTGVSLLLNGTIFSFDDMTRVSFYKLSDQEIKFYIDQYSPLDKAGSYGIQDWMGYVGIRKMEGDFFNVMGLPLHKLYRKINQIIH